MLCLLASLVNCVVFEGVVGITILCELMSVGEPSCVHWCHQHTCAVCYIGVVGRTACCVLNIDVVSRAACCVIYRCYR